MRTETITTQPQRSAEAVFDLVRTAARRRRIHSRRERMLAAARDLATPRTIVIAGGALVVAVGLAYAGRKLFWQAVAVTAEAVEEVADAVEDAVEDLGEATRTRTDGGTSGGGSSGSSS